MISLPIPDAHSNCPYATIASPHPSFPSMEKLLLGLGCKDAMGTAHLDPDLRPEAKARPAGWRPALGQSGSALGHLRKHGVTQDDIFLFYGLFQEVVAEPDGRLAYTGKKQQVLWGWLQVAEVRDIRKIFNQKKYAWLRDHPHMQDCTRKDDAVFISRDSLSLPFVHLPDVSGAGVFEKIRPELVLSYTEGKSFTNWRLPGFFYPSGKTPLTYHGKQKYRREKDGYCYLDRVSIGQEFILRGDEYMPDLGEWLHKLFTPTAHVA